MLKILSGGGSPRRSTAVAVLRATLSWRKQQHPYEYAILSSYHSQPNRSVHLHVPSPAPSSLQGSGAHISPLGGALGDLHKRSWNAQHVQDLEKQCGTDKVCICIDVGISAHFTDCYNICISYFLSVPFLCYDDLALNKAKWRHSLTALARKGKTVHLKAAVDRMSLMGLPVQGAHIRLLLDSCQASRNPALACQYLEQYSTNSSSGDPLAPVLHPALFLHALKICGTVGDPATSARLLDLMQRHGGQGGQGGGLPAAALTAHMHAFATAGDLSGALSILSAAHTHPSNSSSPSFSSPPSHPEDALLQLPLGDISLADYNILLRACTPAHSADFDTAQRLFQQLVARGLQPNSHTWSAVIQAAARAGRPDEGLSILRAMVQQHYSEGKGGTTSKLTPHSFNHLLTAYSKM